MGTSRPPIVGKLPKNGSAADNIVAGIERNTVPTFKIGSVNRRGTGNIWTVSRLVGGNYAIAQIHSAPNKSINTDTSPRIRLVFCNDHIDKSNRYRGICKVN